MPTMKQRILLLMTMCLFLFAGPVAARDNFIVFLIDDVGVDSIGVYSDDTAYGHPGEGAVDVVTPRIDTLAEQGVLFRNAYTNPACAPSRAQLLTGRHALRTGIGTAGGAVLDLSETTLPELLSFTHDNAAIGKWHLGPGGDAEHPVNSGFDYFAGSLGAAVSSYTNWEKVTHTAGNSPTVDPAFTTYATDDVSAEAIARISDFGDDPFFLWVAFNAPHGPFHVPTGPLITAVDSSSNNRTKYVAALEAMDREIGDIIDSMDPAVLADTTVFIIGDNGTPSGVTRSPFDSSHAKGTVYEGGINVPMIVLSPHVDTLDVGTESMALVNSVDVFATIAEIAGVTSSAEDSISMLPYLNNPALPTSPLRPYAYAELFNPNGVGIVYSNHERAITDGTYKLIWRNDVFEEFFDLTANPFEDANLLPYDSMTEAQQLAYDLLSQNLDGLEAAGNAACPGIPDPGCTVGFAKAQIDWRVRGGDGDKLRIKMKKGPAFDQIDYGNPTLSPGTAYGLCVYDDSGNLGAEIRVARAGNLCDGKDCWQTLGGAAPDGKGYIYKDKLLSSSGVAKVQLRAGDTGKSKWKLDAKDENLPDGIPTSLLTTSEVTIQLHGSNMASCLSATLADIGSQEAERFKASE